MLAGAAAEEDTNPKFFFLLSGVTIRSHSAWVVELIPKLSVISEKGRLFEWLFLLRSDLSTLGAWDQREILLHEFRRRDRRRGPLIFSPCLLARTKIWLGRLISTPCWMWTV